jgi:hypothetical protein
LLSSYASLCRYPLAKNDAARGEGGGGGGGEAGGGGELLLEGGSGDADAAAAKEAAVGLYKLNAVHP